MKKIKENLNKILFLVAGFVFIVPTYAFADGANYGQNFGNYALEQIFYVAVVFIAISLVGCLMKRNVTGIVVTIIIGIVVVGIIKDPTGLQDMGTSLWNIIKG